MGASGKGPVSRALEGKTIVVTGTLEKHSRDEIHEIIQQHGGRPTSSVSKRPTTSSPERKRQQAGQGKELGVTVISEEEFEELLRS